MPFVSSHAAPRSIMLSRPTGFASIFDLTQAGNRFTTVTCVSAASRVFAAVPPLRANANRVWRTRSSHRPVKPIGSGGCKPRTYKHASSGRIEGRPGGLSALACKKGILKMGAVFSCSMDDGHPSDMRAAELLSKNGLNATFFIPVRNREGRKVLSKTEIRAIGQLFEIGSHTYDHCFLKNLPAKEALYQVNEGKTQLEDMLGRKVYGFCYPGGKYRKEHTDIVAAAGFRYARTTVNLCFDTGDHPFEMPTTFQFYPHDRNVYLRNFIKGGNWSRRRQGLKLALSHPNWIDRLYALFDYSAQNGSVFHLWGHSKDIDELDAWNELDRFLAHVSRHVATSDRLSNERLAAKRFLSS